MSNIEMSASGVTDTETMVPGRQPPSNLVSYFTQTLKSFQLSETTFSVLCSVSSSSAYNDDSTTTTNIAAPPTPRPLKQTPRTLVILDSSFNPPTLAHQRMALSAWADHRRAAATAAAAPRDYSRLLLLLAINNADKAPKPAAFPQRLAMMYVFALDLLSTAARRSRQAVPDSGGQGSSTSTSTGTTSSAGPKEQEQEEDMVVDIAVTTEPYFHSKSNAIATSEFYRGGGGGGPPAATATVGGEMEQLYLTGFDTLIRIFDAKYYPNDSMRQALDPFLARSRLRVTMRTDADWGSAADQRAYLEGLRNGDRLGAMGGRKEWAERVEMVDKGERDEGDVDDTIISSTKVRAAVQREDWQALRRLVSDGVSEWVKTQGLYKEEDVRRLSSTVSSELRNVGGFMI